MAGRRRCWCIDDFRDGELTPTNIDVIECSRLEPAFRGKSAALAAGLRYHASIPLYFQDKPLGIMNVTGPEWRKLTPDELRLMSTMASLSFFLFTLPAGLLADKVDRQKLVYAINLSLAAAALGLAVLGWLHLLNPYLMLVGVFFIGVGFAFNAPAWTSIVPEVVSDAELPSAVTLSGCNSTFRELSVRPLAEFS